MAEHSPGRVVYDANWRELKLEENGCVIATLPAPHPVCRGKERIEELATIRANGERLAALWNAATLAPKRYALNPDNGLMYESERGPWVRHMDASGVMVPEPPQRHALCGNCMTPRICREDGPGCKPAAGMGIPQPGQEKKHE